MDDRHHSEMMEWTRRLSSRRWRRHHRQRNEKGIKKKRHILVCSRFVRVTKKGRSRHVVIRSVKKKRYGARLQMETRQDMNKNDHHHRNNIDCEMTRRKREAVGDSKIEKEMQLGMRKLKVRMKTSSSCNVESTLDSLCQTKEEEEVKQQGKGQVESKHQSWIRRQVCHTLP